MADQKKQNPLEKIANSLEEKTETWLNPIGYELENDLHKTV